MSLFGVTQSTFSLRKVFYQVLTAFGFIKSSISINRSQVILFIKLDLFFFNKILCKEKLVIQRKENSTLQIKQFLLELSQRKNNRHLLHGIHLNLGIEGSGILIRLLSVNIQKDQPLLNNIVWQLKKSMPYSLSSAYIQYRVVHKTATEVQVIVCLLKKEFLDDLLNIFSQLDMVIGNLFVTSLHIASQRYHQSKDGIGIFVQGKDYNLSLKRIGKKIVFFEILHDDDSPNAFKKIQTLWKQNDFENDNKLPVYFFRKNLSLAIEINEFNRFEGLKNTQQYNETVLDHFDLAEANSLLTIKSLSPQLLPTAVLNKTKQSKFLYQSLGWFLIFQLIIPFLYLQIEKSSTYLIRNTSYSTINNEIRKSQKQLEEIVSNQQRIIQLMKYVKLSRTDNSNLLKLLSSRNLARMVLTRISKKSRKIFIEGYSKDIQTLSVFMESLEEDNHFGAPQLKKTAKKGEVISFQITLKKPRNKRK